MESNAWCIVSAQLTGDTTAAATTVTGGMVLPLLSNLKGAGKYQRQKRWPNLTQL